MVILHIFILLTIQSKAFKIFLLLSFSSLLTQGKEWPKEKWKEKEFNYMLYETHSFSLYGSENSPENRSEWQGISTEINVNEGTEIDAPANPDDPDAPIDKPIIYLVLAGLILGIALKNKRLEKSLAINGLDKKSSFNPENS